MKFLPATVQDTITRNRILVLPDEVGEKTKGDHGSPILISEREQQSEQFRMTVGKVIEMAPGVDVEFVDRPLKVGDRIHYCQFAGAALIDEIFYRVMNDTDVFGREVEDEVYDEIMSKEVEE